MTLFNNAACTTPVGGMASDVAAGGTFAIAISGGPNTVTTIYARATDPAGNNSGCSTTGFSYSEDSDPPAQATFTGTTPVSPSATDSTPTINGNAEDGATVFLYETEDCSDVAVQGIATGGTFAITATDAPNTARTFRAEVVDPAGNSSGCSTDKMSYTHDDSAPAAPTGLATIPVSPSSVSSPTLTGAAEPGAK